MDNESFEMMAQAFKQIAQATKIQAAHAAGLTPQQISRAERWKKQNKKQTSEFSDIEY